MSLNSKSKFLLLSAVAALGIGAANASSCLAAEIAPEVNANVWEESEQECAAVSVNGKDLITYRGTTSRGDASDKAEEIADQLEKIFENEKLDPEKITPAKEGDYAVIKVDGAVAIRFEVPETVDGQKAASSNPMEASLKLANAIREALGATQLPNGNPKVANEQPDMSQLKAAGKAIFSGAASWYGGRFHGRRAADGSRFDQFGLTAAHRSLPFGTKLLVTNRRTGNSCIVQVNDRGPFVADRVIDLSRGAAEQLNMVSSGVAMVDCVVLR
ncbi:MAG: septal ring lytic transglycosylase RlpA family protein [Candidatus Melainabacteria bacterium]|jgi:rare lipoprotein A|nr:septal ring lytic transglycosylase RlpA family protein [Candidatus Melainabacteria bacterium]